METESLLPFEQLERAAPMIRVSAHPIRLRIIDLLRASELPVGKIAEGAHCEQAITSQHLAVLRQYGILAARRDGQRVFYSLVRRELLALLDCIRSHCQMGGQS